MYEPLTFYLYQFFNYFSGPLLMRFKEATNENLQLRYTHKSFLWNSNFIHLYFSLQNLKSPSLSVELHSRWNKKKTFDPSTSINFSSILDSTDKIRHLAKTHDATPWRFHHPVPFISEHTENTWQHSKKQTLDFSRMPRGYITAGL